MNDKKEKKLTREDLEKLDGSEKMKYEVAEELGLLDTILENGWKSLSSKETGRIGGMISKRHKKR